MTHILCASCGEYCGKLYPPTDTDPAFREGKGENFVTSDREWCCSKDCLDTMAKTSLGLEKIFRRPASFWLSLQSNYDLEKARRL